MPFRWLLLGVFLALTPVLLADPQPAGPGQTNPATLKSLSLEELSQIEVTTPSKEPVKAFQTAAAIYVITGEDIRRSGATSIPEALRLAPGVEVARIDGSDWSIGIRGFGSSLTRSVLVLIDGRTVYTPLFAGTNWDVQNTNMDDIDRIEVIRGPGGTIWGPNAVNGVINIFTKGSKDTQGVQVSAGGGNQEQGFANVRDGGGNGRDFSYRIYGMGFTRGPQYHQDGRNFDDWREVQAGFRMDWMETRDTFTLQGDLYDEVAGKSVGATSYTTPYSQTIEANARLSGGNVLGRWKRVFGEGNDIQVQVYYDRADRHTPNYIENRDTFDVDLLQRLRLPARQEVSWGLGARVDPVNDPVVVSGLQFVPYKRTDYLATAFVQDEIGLVERRLSLILGTKILRTNFISGVDFEPSARLLWTLSDKQTVWAAFTHALRTPSDSEENFYLLGYIGPTPNGTPFFARFNPNTNFTPELAAFAHKSEVLAGHCSKLGTDFDAIVRSANFSVIVGTSDADVKDRQQRIRDRLAGYLPDALLDSMIAASSGPDSTTGTPEQVVERIGKVRDLGCEYAICYFPEAAYDRSGIELFEREVIPALS